MTIRRRLERIEAKLATTRRCLSPIIVQVEKQPGDDEQAVQAKIRTAAGDNPDGRHVVAIILENSPDC